MISKSAHCNWGLVAALVVFLSILLVPSVEAQTAGTGALTGTIKDPSGAVIPNATVTATSADTGQVRVATTGADGTYRLALLPPGNYRVRIEAGGFKPVEIPSATVSVTETALLDRALEVGAQTQTVTVEGEVVAIQTQSSALGTVATARTLTELPLNTRNFTNLLAMSAGVSGNVSDATILGKGATNMAVNGANTQENTYLLDGMVINGWASIGGVTDAVFFGSFVMPNPDAISEFKIQTSSYDAGYGRNPGANVNVVSKSGTNDFHGTAFEFLRNTALNANNWFLNRTGTPKPVLNSNQYGGAVGGPIKKNKVFFYANYQETDQRNGFSPYAEVHDVVPPIPNGNRGTCNGGQPGWYTMSACDAAGQAFIQNLATNMASSTPRQGSTVIQNPSACPVGGCDPNGLFNINPIAINLLQLKLPNGSYYVPTSGTSSYAPVNYVDPATYGDHQGIGNLDYVINAKNTLALHYIFDGYKVNANFGALNALEPGNTLPGIPVQSVHDDQVAHVKLTSILSNNAVNELSIGYQRAHNPSSRTGPQFTDAHVGIQEFNANPSVAPPIGVLASISVNGGTNTGFFTMGPGGPYGSTTDTNEFDYLDQISLSRGKHSFRVGVDAQENQAAAISPFGSAPSITVQSFADLLIGRAGCGPGLVVTPSPANPGGCNGGNTTNLTGSAAGANANVKSYGRLFNISGFVQDDFKVNARFTVNLGLRYEYDPWPTEKNGNFSNFWPSLASAVPAPFVTFPGGAGSTLAGYMVPSNYSGPFVPAGVFQSKSPYYTQIAPAKDNFAPRIGFAWQPTSSNRLVIRGGAGFFYDVLAGNGSANAGDAAAAGPPIKGTSSSGAPVSSLYAPGAAPPGIVPAGPGYVGFLPRWIDLSTVVPVAQSPSAPCLKPPCSSNTSPSSWAPDLTTPLVYEWNLNAQYEFLPSWVLEVGYVGSRGIHQLTPGPVNGGVAADGSGIASTWNTAQLYGGPCASCSIPAISQILAVQGNTNANAILRVPNLGITPTNIEIETNSNLRYNALQATLRKQFSKGLQVQAAFTWARAFEQAQQGINNYPYVVQTYSPEYFVRPLRMVINYVWNLPLGHQKGFLGKLTDDWSWSGVTVIQNGQPQDVVDSSGGRVFGVTAGIAGQMGGAQLCPGMTAANIATSGTTEQRITSALEGGDGWFNSAAFCATPTGVGAVNGVGGGTGWGNMGFGNILGPDQVNFDMSLEKLIKIRESKNLEFRVEFYNAFNHPQFANVVDTDANDRAANGGGFGNIDNTFVNPRVIQFALKFLF